MHRATADELARLLTSPVHGLPSRTAEAELVPSLELLVSAVAVAVAEDLRLA